MLFAAPAAPCEGARAVGDLLGHRTLRNISVIGFISKYNSYNPDRISLKKKDKLKKKWICVYAEDNIHPSIYTRTLRQVRVAKQGYPLEMVRHKPFIAKAS